MDNSVFNKIINTGILPVIKIEKIEHAIPLARSLRKGGINIIEITARSEAAFQSIKAIKENYPDMVVGAGTIHNPKLVQQALNVGSDFIVTPGLSIPTVDFCFEKNVPIIPGCSSSTEFELALAKGLKIIKFFPAEISGGAAALKLYNGPFPDLKFIPTGGITFNNLYEYLDLDCVAACGGSFMAKSDCIRNNDWETITNNCRLAINTSLGFKFAHIGLNPRISGDDMENAVILNYFLNLGFCNDPFAIPSEKNIEFLKIQYPENKGHIVYSTRSAVRAKAWFENNNMGIVEETIQKFGNKITSFYLRCQINGFTIQIKNR